MKTYAVEITGITALLQNRFTEAFEQEKQTRKIRIDPRSPRERAEESVYRNGKGFYFPGAAISRLLRSAGSNHKQRGSRKSLKYIVPAAVLVQEDAGTILNGDGRSVAKDFEVDSRPVTIPATKGRIMRHRPRFDQWSAKFHLEIDETLLGAEDIHGLLTEGGTQIGIGDFRPEKGGPFGRFRVTTWKPASK